MPELPELEVLKENLLSQIKGKKIQEIHILKPYVLKNYFTPLENTNLLARKKKNRLTFVGSESNAASMFLTGCDEKVEDIERRGKYLIIKLTKYKIVIHLMLRGSVKYILPDNKIKKSSAALITFEDGTILEFNETGFKKRMAIHILYKDQTLKQIENLGIEPLQNNFSVDRLKNLLLSEPKQIKLFLRNQKKIAGIGNAYADEILWKARISPFKITTKFKSTEIKNLHQAIIEILEWGISEVRGRGILEKRDFLNIHKKKGKPCPRCSESIQMVSFSDFDTFYCPKCQTQGRKLKDRRISKFYR